MSDDETTPPATIPTIPPAAEASTPDGFFGEVLESLERIRAELADTNERAAARERVIDRLHEENQRMRAGERLLLLRPLLTDLQRLRNELLREATALPRSLPAERAADLLRSFAASVGLSLERGGVEVLRPQPGSPVDAAAHRVVAAVPGPAELAGTVAEVVTDGYRDTASGHVLSAAAVRVVRAGDPVPVPPTEPDSAT